MELKLIFKNKKMKKYIYIVLSAVLFVSCSIDEFLDEKPTGVVIPSTVKDFDLLLNNPIGDGSFQNIDYMDPDVFLNNTLFNNIGTNDLNQRKEYQWNPNQFTFSDIDQEWSKSYARIYVYNSIIFSIDTAPLDSRTEDDRKRVKGEAYAQRAMDYFLLACQYAPAYSTAKRNEAAIPMPLVPDINAQLSRENLDVVFDKIISDLEIAKNLLANEVPVKLKANFRPGKASVNGLLALVNLYIGEFDVAKTYANTTLSAYNHLYDYTALQNVTTGNAWSGVNQPDFKFAENDKSIIWSRVNKLNFTYPFNGQLYSNSLLSIFDRVNDQRFLLFSSDKALDATDSPTIDVSPNVAYASRNKTSQAGLTVGQLLLIKAEASIRSTTPDKAAAIAALNTLLVKRIKGFTPLTNADFADNAAVLKRVKEERRKELIGTGYNFVDQKRYHAYGDAVPTFTRTIGSDTYTLTPGSSNYVLEVSPKVKSLNPNL